jgi:oligopeptide/dipeptide ABC transporter ATP-binding protein
MNGAMIEAVDLSKVFRGRGAVRRSSVTALDGINIHVERGSVFGLVGESGSGKTTLARCLLYLDPPTNGTVVFDGQDVGKLTGKGLRSLRHRMQIIFQDPNNALNPRISVYRSLSEGLANMGVSRPARDARIAELADLVSIPNANMRRKPRDFSGGQRQRLVIARALSMDPEFLILDEPVSNLDVSIQAQIINLLMDLRQQLELTYLFISHDLNLVSYVSDIIGVMYSGQLVEVGPVRSVIESPLHGYTRTLLASAARVRGCRIEGNISVAETTSAAVPGCAFRHRCEYERPDCSSGTPRLVDVGGGHLVACDHAAGLENPDINGIDEP